MSEQVTVSVKLKKLTTDQESKPRHDMALLDEYDIYDYLCDNDLCEIEGSLWAIKERKDFEPNDFIDVFLYTEDELHFSASYYNGGCSFDEVVEEAFAKGVKE